MRLKLKNLKGTRSFYKVELKKKGLIETEKNKYLKALKIVEKIIKEKEKFDKKKNKYFDKIRWFLKGVVLDHTYYSFCSDIFPVN